MHNFVSSWWIVESGDKMDCSGVQWRAWTALLGGVIVHITLGTIYTFGNMSPYFTSYIRQYSEPSYLRYKLSTMIFALTIASQGLFMWFGGFLEGKLGIRLTTLFGAWTMSIGVMMSCLTIQHSFTLLILTYGVLFGIGIGIAYTPPLVCAMRWMPKRKGLVNGLIVAGFGGGAFIFDQVQTAFINPHNLAANVSYPNYPNEKYFEEESLLQRVPASFLLCGGIYAVLQLFGCLLISNPPNYHVDHSGDNKSLITEHNDDDTSNGDNDEGTCQSIQTLDDDPRSSELNLHPKDVIKTRAFWTLWTTFLLNGQVVVFISTLYKAYGQTFISDDKFLALVGSFSAVFNALGRLFWGHIADVYSYKVAMVSLCSCMTALMLSLIATPVGGKAMFFIWICAIFFTLSGNFALFPTATARSFGSEYVGVNYGLVFTSQVVTGPVGAFLSSLLIDTIGWFGMFALNAGFSLCGALLTLTFNLNGKDGQSI